MSDSSPVTPEHIATALAELVARHTEKRPISISGGSLVDVASPWTIAQQLGMVEYISLALHLSVKFRGLPPERISGYRDGYAPSWSSLDVLSDQHGYPSGVSGLFEAGELTAYAMVVQLAIPIEAAWNENSYMVRVHVAPEHGEDARRWLSDTLLVADLEHNILRGRVVELSSASGAVIPKVVATPRASLSDVVVSDMVRTELERNVIKHVESSAALAKIGIGSNRGVLLWGPPGTGKTSLVRGCISALAGGMTVLLPDADMMASALPAVYREAVRLAPCLVVLEDIDVVAADRHGKDAGLAAFLSALDGVISDPDKLVVTLATTNNPAGIDQAAKRPGRIDCMIEVPAPDTELRRTILVSYLNKLEEAGVATEVSDAVLDGLASGSGGASGAVLREVIRRSLLEAGGTLDSVVDDRHLLSAAAEVGYRSVEPYCGGLYL